MNEVMTDSYTTCEHGLSSDLCCGPSHYPPDNQFFYEDDVSERYAGEYIPADWDYDVPTEGELMFTGYGLLIQSENYCDATGGWHALGCVNDPGCPF